jgi:predicted nucleotide-binding protein (sugar kinase/HSP70/actin superfamily)
MPKTVPFEVECPCCGATLKIDPEVKAILSHTEKPRPKALEDISTGVQRLKAQEQAREEAFRKSFESMKSSKDVLNRKFDELLKKAKEDDPSAPPPKPIGLE